ncbi:MAG: hypothetical protein Kow0031_22480 [Anaerolineae bacterium]
MQKNEQKASWPAIGLFYVVLIIIVTVVDVFNNLLRPGYWGAQVALITVGVGIFLAIGHWLPNLSAARSVLLAFTVGILTIIPAVLMGLGPIPDLWPQYFFIAFGMAAGSFLTFLFLKYVPGTEEKSSDYERD